MATPTRLVAVFICLREGQPWLIDSPTEHQKRLFWLTIYSTRFGVKSLSWIYTLSCAGPLSATSRLKFMCAGTTLLGVRPTPPAAGRPGRNSQGWYSRWWENFAAQRRSMLAWPTESGRATMLVRY